MHVSKLITLYNLFIQYYQFTLFHPPRWAIQIRSGVKMDWYEE